MAETEATVPARPWVDTDGSNVHEHRVFDRAALLEAHPASDADATVVVYLGRGVALRSS